VQFGILLFYRSQIYYGKHLFVLLTILPREKVICRMRKVICGIEIVKG